MAKEYIERETALKIIDKYSKTVKEDRKVIVKADGKAIVKAVRDIVDFICPASDVQEVVRCKDCKWLNKTKMICTCPNNRVFNTGKTVYSNHFCGYGAKMDKE
ncbi:MAG: hypothetical protein ACI4HZ_11085 [Ruminococcus sp.]